MELNRLSDCWVRGMQPLRSRSRLRAPPFFALRAFACMKRAMAKPKGGAKLQSGRDRLVIAATSVFGLGLAPIAPGTFGTVAALPLWWLADDWPILAFVALVAAITIFGTWVANLAEPLYGGHDASQIVIDEVAGMLVCVIGIPFTPVTAVVGFITFRLFDIVKPPPIRLIDKQLGGGLGVMLDDVAAGLLGLGVMHGLAVVFGW